jgi:hypothetical protein
MAAGLGYKEWQTGDVLTAGDVNGYLNQGVWVFDDATARTAAVTSPEEGNVSYLKDTNTVEYYSGAAWVGVGAASGLTLISTTTLSNTTSINSAFSASYDNYLIIGYEIIGSTGGDGVALRLRASGSDSTSSYESRNMTITSSLSGGANAYTDRFEPGTINSSNETYFMFHLFNPFAAKKTSFVSSGYRSGTALYQIGLHTATTSYSGITLYPTGGTLAGKVKIYGYSN